MPAKKQHTKQPPPINVDTLRAATFEGYAGPFKVQIAGPWTLAASIELASGAPVASDRGARADLAASLAHGSVEHCREVQRLIPHAELIVQIDEPSIVAIWRGEVPTASGWGTVRPVDRAEIAGGLAQVAQALPGRVVVHCCHPSVPADLLLQSGVDGLSLDLAAASERRWDEVAQVLADRGELWAGLAGNLSSDRGLDTVLGKLSAFREPITITPPCGLAGLTVVQARSVHEGISRVATELRERAES